MNREGTPIGVMLSGGMMLVEGTERSAPRGRCAALPLRSDESVTRAAALRAGPPVAVPATNSAPLNGCGEAALCLPSRAPRETDVPDRLRSALRRRCAALPLRSDEPVTRAVALCAEPPVAVPATISANDAAALRLPPRAASRGRKPDSLAMEFDVEGALFSRKVPDRRLRRVGGP